MPSWGCPPAENQIKDFEKAYRVTKSYDAAARSCCFKGLAPKIISMLEATGAARHLGLTFKRRDSFDGHPDILADSLIKCATLDGNGKSKDWRPRDFGIAKVCIARRFLTNMLNLQFTRLKTIVILGEKGWDAINDRELTGSKTIYEQLSGAGKRVIKFPHPAGGNNEYVALVNADVSR